MTSTTLTLSNEYYKHKYMRYIHATDMFDIKFPLRNSRIENIFRYIQAREP